VGGGRLAIEFSRTINGDHKNFMAPRQKEAASAAATILLSALRRNYSRAQSQLKNMPQQIYKHHFVYIALPDNQTFSWGRALHGLFGIVRPNDRFGESVLSKTALKSPKRRTTNKNVVL